MELPQRHRGAERKFGSSTRCPLPPPGWFLAKSAESLENKGVEFFVVQKSAEESEKTEVRWKSSVFCRELTGCRQTLSGFGGTARRAAPGKETGMQKAHMVRGARRGSADLFKLL
jgi:hypothetical protein